MADRILYKQQQHQVMKSDELEKVLLPTNESSNTLLTIRHSCAHVMAMAVQKIFPEAKATIGPWIENGFYYDFDMAPLTDKELKRIKKEMDCTIGRNLPIIREEVSRDEAHRNSPSASAHRRHLSSALQGVQESLHPNFSNKIIFGIVLLINKNITNGLYLEAQLNQSIEL